MKQPYIILYALDADVLAKGVSEKMGDGYMLAGSAYYAGIHYQPMLLAEYSPEIRALKILAATQEEEEDDE